MEKKIAVILAGGRSSRMGGQPKCLCSLGEERIIDSLLTRLTPQVDEIFLNIAPGSSLAEDIFKHPTHKPAHISVVEDLYSSFSGPLAGIASSMQYLRARNSSAKWLLSVASDTPFIPPDLYSRFLQATRLHNNHVYVAQHNHQQQYIFALWNIALLPQLDAILRSNEKYRMQYILR
jgi:molybdopterin-guanine dinucleotide biosynthesis protein A